MKIVGIKNNKVVAVWREDEHELHIKQFAPDETVNIEDDVVVRVGMEKTEGGFVSVIDEEVRVEEELIVARQEVKTRIIEELGEDSQRDAIISQINALRVAVLEIMKVLQGGEVDQAKLAQLLQVNSIIENNLNEYQNKVASIIDSKK